MSGYCEYTGSLASRGSVHVSAQQLPWLLTPYRSLSGGVQGGEGGSGDGDGRGRDGAAARSEHGGRGCGGFGGWFGGGFDGLCGGEFGGGFGGGSGVGGGGDTIDEALSSLHGRHHRLRN